MSRLLLVAAMIATVAPTASAELPPLIPRDVLFGNPDKAGPQISPDGKHLAYLAPDDKNVLQVWVRPIDKADDEEDHQRRETRHPPVLLGVRRQAPPLPAGRGRRRELPPLRVGTRHR